MITNYAANHTAVLFINTQRLHSLIFAQTLGSVLPVLWLSNHRLIFLTQ